MTLLPEKLRVAVITHAIDEFERGGYLLHRLLEHWQPNGVEIMVVKGADPTPPQADLAISHIDMTAVDDAYARVYDAYPLVINGRVRDIAKTRFSDQIVTREDNYRGAVIVKTDRNFGGMREMRERALAGDPSANMDVQRPWRRVEFLPAYPAFRSAGDVPLGVWRNPNLVVEKFLPERNEDGQYVLRVWVFFGDRGIYYQCISDEPIIKSHNTIRRISLDVAAVPDALRRKREELGFDYGKFDFGMIDGEAVLYDVNRTPGSPGSGKETDRVVSNIRNLAEGLEFFTRQLNA